MPTKYLKYLVIVVSFNCFGQKDTTFFDKNWKKCNRSEAEYFRTVKKEGENYSVTDHYLSNQPQMIATCSQLDPLIKNGKCSFFDSSGFKTSEGNYMNNKPLGKWIWWDEESKDSTIVEYKPDGTKNFIRLNKNLIKKNTRLEVSLPEMTINNHQFISLIDSLITGENKCNYWDNTLMGFIEIDSANVNISGKSLALPSYVLHIGIGSETLNRYKPTGYFIRKNIPFIVTGIQIPNLFSINSKKQTFHYMSNEHLYDDYSIWDYLYTNEKFVYDYGYKFPCEQTEPLHQNKLSEISDSRLMGSWEFVKSKQPASISQYADTAKEYYTFSFYQNKHFQIAGNETSYFKGYFIGKWKTRKDYLTMYNQGSINEQDSSFFSDPFDEILKIKILTDSTLVLYADTARDGNFVGEYTFKKTIPKPYLNYIPRDWFGMPMKREE